jgi:hypothetical protein
MLLQKQQLVPDQHCRGGTKRTVGDGFENAVFGEQQEV